MKNTNTIQPWYDENGYGNITFDDVKSKERDKNEDRYGCDGCFICMRPLKENTSTKWVHYTTGGQLVDTVDEIEDSQGMFPVGSDCAKKLPKSFIFEL